MPDSGLPNDVEQFISESIRSVEHLEVLLAMAALPGAKWTVSDLFAIVRSSEASILARLEELARHGLVSKEGEIFRFAPRNETVRATVEALGRAYKERSLRVIQTIYSERRRAARELSDAFRFRRKAKDG